MGELCFVRECEKLIERLVAVRRIWRFGWEIDILFFESLIIFILVLCSKSRFSCKNYVCSFLCREVKIETKSVEIEFSPRTINLYGAENLTLYTHTAGSLHFQKIHCWEKKKKKKNFMSALLLDLKGSYLTFIQIPSIVTLCYHGNPAPLFPSVKDVGKGGMRWEKHFVLGFVLDASKKQICKETDVKEAWKNVYDLPLLLGCSALIPAALCSNLLVSGSCWKGRPPQYVFVPRQCWWQRSRSKRHGPSLCDS